MQTLTKALNLKEKVLQVLESKKVGYAELAALLSLSEAELDHALEKNTLEIRTFELIAKELRVPLYSFFRKNLDFHFEAEPYSDTLILNKDDNKTLDIKALRQEIEDLRLEVRQKDLLIEALEAQIINK